MDSLGESLKDYIDNYFKMIPKVQKSPFSVITTSDVTEVLECTCDTMTLMHTGCHCGTMRQERELGK